MDAETCFSTIVEKWPTPQKRNSLNIARGAFCKKATPEICEKVMQAFEYAKEDGAINYKPLWLWLAEQLNSIDKSTKKVYKKASLYSDDSDYTDFYVIWEAWPKNSKWDEKQEYALGAWSASVKKYGLDVVKLVCTYYISVFCDPSNGMVHPYHLGNFLSNDAQFSEWRTKGSAAPSKEDVVDFESTYAWYPDFNGKSDAKNDSLLFWARHVQKSDRWAFLSAVKNYRDKIKKDISNDAKKYTKSFISFVGSWQESTEYFRVMASDVSQAIVEAAKKNGLVNGQDTIRAMGNMHGLMIGCLISQEGNIDKSIKHAVDYIFAKNEVNGKQLDLDRTQLVADIKSSAWQSACRHPLV